LKECDESVANTSKGNRSFLTAKFKRTNVWRIARWYNLTSIVLRVLKTYSGVDRRTAGLQSEVIVCYIDK
jgi:hypothetical protein